MSEPQKELSFKDYFLPITNVKAIHFIIIIGVLIYGYSLLNGFVADDNVYILQNPHITNFNIKTFLLGSSYYSGDVTSLSGIYYKPLFTFVISLIYKLSNGTPFLFHLLQLILHIINSCLLLFLFNKFFGRKIALFLAILFLVHPANVESVVYIANFQEPLFFFFGMTALLVISYSKKITWKNMSVISVLLLLSLLSKESGILFLPSSIALFAFLHRKNMRASLIIVAATFAVYLFMRLVIARVLVNHQAIAPIMDASIYERILTMPKIIATNISLFFLPKDLSWGHHWVVKNPDVTNFYIPLGILFITFAALATLYMTIRKKKELAHTFLFFLVISFFGLGLHLQIIPLDFTFADRWMYFPIVGFLGLVGVFLQSNSSKKVPVGLIVLVAITLLGVFSTRSFVRTLDWKDDYTLTSHDVIVDPESFVLHNNLAYALIQQNKYEEAKKHLEIALTLYPTQSGYDNLAFVYSKLGNHEKSLELYRKSLNKGNFYMTYQNFIAELIRQKKNEEAKKQTQEALKKYPNNPKLWLLLAVSEYNLGNTDVAIKSAQQANFLSPGSGNFVLLKITNKEQIPL